MSCFYFLEDSVKFHRNIPYVLYTLKMCVFRKYSEKNSKSKNVCWHDTEGEHFVQAGCSRNRLWSRTPLCWFNTLHVRVLRKFAEKKSQNVCWNLFWFFFKYTKVSCFTSYASVKGNLELPLLKGRRRFDVETTSNLEVYIFRGWWILT